MWIPGSEPVSNFTFHVQYFDILYSLLGAATGTGVKTPTPTSRKIISTALVLRLNSLTSYLHRISAAPVFDPVNGFGGDGVAGTYNLPSTKLSANKIVPSTFRGCVRNGPFANYTLNLGPGKLATRHCLTRGITNSGRKYLSSTSVAAITKVATYDTFRAQLEGQAGTSNVKMFEAGQDAVGGEMGNAYSSPGGKCFTSGVSS